MEQYIKAMTDSINFYIEMAYRQFQIDHKHDDVALSKIRGMIMMLQIITGKQYQITAEGLKEV